jgi:hypothetical protein
MIAERDALAQALTDLTADLPKGEVLVKLMSKTPTLAAMEHLEAEVFLEGLRNRYGLPREFIAALRRDILAARKAKEREEREARKTGGPPQTVTYTAMLPGLVDLVEHEGAPAFLMLTGNGLGIATEWEHDGVLYSPPPERQIPWLLPRGEEVMKWHSGGEPPSVLYDDLRSYHKGISELPAEGYYDLLTAWTFHTHLLEAAQYSPEICLYAVPERGKTRAGKGAVYTARRGVHVESLRDAYLVRLAHNFQASIFFDVMSLWKKAEKAGSEDVILGRFERGIKVPRVLYPERGPHRDTVFYDIFGPTLIATNVAVHGILDSRGVQVNMPQSNGHFEEDVTPEAALPLKERLTAWRAHQMGKPLPECRKPAAGRLGDILKPLLQIIRLVKPDREAVFMGLVKELEQGRLMDKADSLEGQILKVVWDLRDKVRHKILPVKTITDVLNNDKPEWEKLTYQKVGRRLKSLGLKKASTADSAAAIEWDEQKISQICWAYGMGKTSVTSVIPESQADSAFPAGRFADVSDVSQKPHEKRPSANPHESCVPDVTDVSDVFSTPVQEENQILSKEAQPSDYPLLFAWHPDRQRQAAAKVRQDLAHLDPGLLEGLEEIEL